MSSSLLEIVELEDGEIVLRYAGEEGEPLVTIRFSEESRDYIGSSTLDIAKVMIQSGIQAASHMDVIDEPEDLEPVIAEGDSEKPVNHTLH